MTHLANHSASQQGKFRRVFGAVWAFLLRLEATSFDYSLDRIERLEREVAQLKEEMRQSQEQAAVVNHSASPAALEH